MKSKYAYLVQRKIVRAADLDRAMSIARETNTSVETVLVNRFRVPVEAIGRLLSAVHGCKFVAYDPQMPIAIEMFGDLDKSQLLQECWAPLSWDANGIVVLVDDPADEKKQQTIKATLRTEWVIFAVGIREDIEKLIKRSFYQLQVDDLVSEVVAERRPVDLEKLINTIISEAYMNDATEILFQSPPPPVKSRVLFRMLGVYREWMEMTDATGGQIIKKIKSMARLDTRDNRLPKIGYIKFEHEDLPELLVSVTMHPTANPREEVVLQIQNRQDTGDKFVTGR